jgi:hypothetical protein
MKILFVTALVFAQTVGGPVYKGQARDPHPFAPTLPKLTEKEEQELTDVVDRFIDQDTGKLKGAAAAKAIADFKALGPAATFALLDGLNKAANMEDSCPAVLIAKKLSTIIRGSKDAELLEFLRENIGNDVSAKRHTNVLKDLRVACMLRKGELQRIELAMGGKKAPAVSGTKTPAKDKGPKTMTTPELVTAVGKEKGDALKPVLVELGTRSGAEVIQALAVAAGNEDGSTQKLAQSLLVEVLGRQSADELKGSLKKGGTAVRTAAARAIGDKGYKLVDELIAALNDSEETVRQAARGALVKLADSKVDHGPEAGASDSQRLYAQRQWTSYWQK